MLRHGEAAHDAVSGQTDEFGVVSTPHIFGAIGQDEHTVGVQRMDRSLVVGDEDNSATEVSDSVENLCSACLLYTSPSPRDRQKSRMPSSA